MGHVYVGDRMEEGWKESIPCYLFKCPKHGLVLSYVRGYNKYLVCPNCLEEARLIIEAARMAKQEKEQCFSYDPYGQIDQTQPEIY
jgi:hypothetical protein